MKHWIMLTFLAVVLAGCGGSSNRADKLEMELEEARQDAEEAKQQAERERQARETAEQQRDSAQRERDQAQGEVADAEEDARQAEQERDEAQQKLNRFVALEIVNAIPATPTGTVPRVPETLTYNEPVLATATGATFTSTSTGSSGGWFRTTRSGSGEQRRDLVEIFSNVEAPFREDIRDYSARTTIPRGVSTTLPWNLTFDEQGRPTNNLAITTANAGSIAASSRFPRPSTQRQGEVETFTVADRGEFDADKRSDPTYTDDDGATNPTYRSFTRYPERYSVDISGTLQGAPGIFRCAGATAGGTCTVNLSGPDNYVFGGAGGAAWQYIPTSATSKVIIPDGEYMWFGWWMREPIETTPNAADAVFSYAANYGGTNPVTDVTGATGSATYEGAAIGYYGFYDIEAAEDDRSRSGRFQAKATLTADFDATGEGTLSGSITEFDTEPTWSVTLKSQAIASGVVAAAADTVSWTIRGLPRDGGQWEAAFHSNFESPATTAQPTGVVGAFTAQYGAHRKMVGAFGAERD